MSEKAGTATLALSCVVFLVLLGVALASGVTTLRHALVTETGPWVTFSLVLVGAAVIVQVIWGVLSWVYKAGKESR